MRAAIFRNGEIVVDQMPEPTPGEGMVLVKSLACGICGSDLHARKHAHRMVELAKHFPGRKPMDLARRVRSRILLRGAGLRAGHAAQAEARH
jgi:NADPH:quinone reductase-like Zn-dependent oxidoreductase